MDDLDDGELTVSKPWWLSKAVVGAVVTVAVGLAGIAGWSIDAAQTTELVLSLATTIFGAISWYGSVQRKTTIDKQQVLPGVRLDTISTKLFSTEPKVQPHVTRDSTDRTPPKKNPFLD